MKLKNDKTLNIALTAVFACIVFVLSYLGSFVHIGAISFALTLIPIVLGGIYIGPWAGAFLGAVFGLTVLFTDVTALALLSINWFYAFLGCVVRGVIAGWLPAFVLKLPQKKRNRRCGCCVCPCANHQYGDFFPVRIYDIRTVFYGSRADFGVFGSGTFRAGWADRPQFCF